MADKTPQDDGPEGMRMPLDSAEETADAAVGTLTLKYTDGLPTLTLSGGDAMPQAISVVDESGNAIAYYTANSGPAPRLFNFSGRF
ncbi:hypothetical protein [Streptomyces sp. NPDC088707]|uniref:hypothetical protein n=1 Tax=Streptomyces sp. NPDC088707 TaxID=3365871 RepID=UPI0038234103